MEEENKAQPLLVLLVVLQLATVLAIGFVGWKLHSDVVVLTDTVQSAGAGGGGGGNAPARQPQEAPEPQNVDDWESLIRDHNAVIGPEDAEVTVIEFSDFECPFCRRFYDQTMGQLLEEYEGEIRFVYKHLPLTQIHPNAMGAAIAAQCAKQQGKFWEMHDAIFDNPEQLKDGEAGMLELGNRLGLGDDYAQCVQNDETKGQVEQDMDDAVNNGVRGTPGFLVNGKLVSGALPFARFKAEIEGLQ